MTAPLKHGWFEHMKRTRQCDTRGAALVEAAMVVVPLCLIIFGLIEFGFIFKDSMATSNASRAGARVGAAEGQAPTFYKDILAAVTTAGTGASFQNGDAICIYQVNNSVNTSGVIPGNGNLDNCTDANKGRKFTYVAATKTWSGNQADGSPWPAASRDVCLGDSTVDSVGVALSVSHKSVTSFFGNFNNMKLKEHTVMRLEPPAGGGCS